MGIFKTVVHSSVKLDLIIYFQSLVTPLSIPGQAHMITAANFLNHECSWYSLQRMVWIL